MIAKKLMVGEKKFLKSHGLNPSGYLSSDDDKFIIKETHEPKNRRKKDKSRKETKVNNS